MRKLLLDILILSVAAFGILWLLDSSVDAQCAGGQCPTQRAPVTKGNPAVVRISVKDKDGRNSLGSGAVFRQERKIAYVLTVAHVIADRTKGDSVIVYVNGGAYQATILAEDKLWDVAILRIADPRVTPLILANTPPGPGDSVECSGLGQEGVYSYFQGRMTQYIAPGGRGTNNLPEWMEVRTTVRQGDSGGPIVNTKGRIVGLITGTGGGVTVGPCLPRIRQIIRGILTPICPPLRPAPAAPPSSEAPEIPSTPLPADINYDLLATAILKQINPDDFRGPAGPIGRTGKDGPIGLPGADGGRGPVGPRGSSGITPEIDMDDLAEKIKKLINGSVRIKVKAVPSK